MRQQKIKEIHTTIPAHSGAGIFFLWRRFLYIKSPFSSACILFAFAAFLSACENDLKDVEKITRTGNEAQEELEEVTMVYSDSGYTRAVLTTPLLERFDSDTQEKLQFAKGLKITFYQPGKIAESHMSAEFGLLDIRQRTLLLRDKVVFINFANEDTVNTEQINWSQDSSKIYTDKTVYVKRKNGLFKSQGMTSNETFTKYKFYNISAIAHFILNEDEEDTEE
jgi:LPS export ABC transporter protein LptC